MKKIQRLKLHKSEPTYEFTYNNLVAETQTKQAFELIIP